MIYELQDSVPQIDKGAWIAPDSVIVGDVEIGEKVSVWFKSVIRGDTASIRVGKGSNVQDLTMLHGDPGFNCVIGENVTIGHHCVIHGAHIGDNSMIGMGAIVMNGAKIGENSIVGAGSLVPQNKEFPAGYLILGSPAKAVRPLQEHEIAGLAASALHYQHASKRFADTLRAQPSIE